jgi:hypothetical protein
MIYDLEHRQAALLVIDVQGEYFDENGPPTWSTPATSWAR